MQVFIYEFITGGGLWSYPDWGEPNGTLLTEGMSMVEAIASDFALLPDTKVVVLRDARIENRQLPNIEYVEVNSACEEDILFQRLAKNSDITQIIAPEIDNVLVHKYESAIAAGGRLLNADLAFTRLASDKHATAVALRAAGVAAPNSLIGNSNSLESLSSPFVVKPRFGAGSVDVKKITCLDEIRGLTMDESICLQEYMPGRPASISVIPSVTGQHILPPCWQHFEDQTNFRYLGGETITETALVERAQQLALSTIRALPDAHGYFGIDLVLGESEFGFDDFVIEINPRLTTSYVGVRAALDENLAKVLLAALNGEPHSCLRLARSVSFSPNGITQNTTNSPASKF